MLIEKARQFGDQLDVDPEFCYSKGWLHRFKSCHNIKGYKASADMSVVSEARDQLKKDLSNWDPNDVKHL